MNIRLFDVSDHAVEEFVDLVAVDEDVPFNLADCLPLADDVQQGRLAGSRGSHEGEIHAGLDVPRHIFEELQLRLPEARQFVEERYVGQHPSAERHPIIHFLKREISTRCSPIPFLLIEMELR